MSESGQPMTDRFCIRPYKLDYKRNQIETDRIGHGASLRLARVPAAGWGVGRLLSDVRLPPLDERRHRRRGTNADSRAADSTPV
jgi:hypothetical protein